MGGFLNMKPAAKVDYVVEAMDSLQHSDPDQYLAAAEIIQDKRFTAQQVADAFRELGYEAVDVNRVRHYRSKVASGKVVL